MFRDRSVGSRALSCATTLLSTAFLAATAVVALPAAAGETAIGGCMEENAGFGLNCTANDVQIAKATNITILDDGCAFPGDQVTFIAEFMVVLTAQERHDIGLYFDVSGDPEFDGAISGTCNVSTVPFAPDPVWLDLDGTNDGGFCANDPALFCETDRDCKSVGGTCAFTQDLCGDIDADHNPLYPTIEITTQCIDPDGNGKLNLPNCTSWRQPGANDLCLEPADAFPGSPSKCNCDLGFEVDIDVPPATLTVLKTPRTTQVNEPGADVIFDLSITNDSPFAGVEITELVDDMYGDVTALANTTCTVPQALAPGATYTCWFEAFVSGQGGEVHRNVVTVTGNDENFNSLTDDDDAIVPIVDLPPSINVTKTAGVTEVLEPGEDVPFTITVTNTSAADTVQVFSLVDTVYGDLDGQGNCALPVTLDLGASYSCTFSGFVGGMPGDVHMNVATASAADEEGNETSASDSAMVNINDVPSSIEVTKVASPTTVDEPGGLVTYTYSIQNKSFVDTVIIDAFVDDILGDLDGQGDCVVPQLLNPGQTYTCLLTTFVAGNAGDAVVNVAEAFGTDDDGGPVYDSDDATVNVANVAPAASLTKTVTSMVVTYEVSVKNDSTAEPLTVTDLWDDQFGDVTVVGGGVVSTACTVPVELSPKGQAGDSYTCSFEGFVDSSPHTNTVIGTVVDDEGGAVQPEDSATVSY